MIYLIKDTKYFKNLRDLHKNQCFFISYTDRNNISTYDLENIFTSNLYKYYFFENTPFLYFFSNFKFKTEDEIFLLIDNISYTPLNLRIKSTIIMEKTEKRIENQEPDIKLIRQLIIDLLKLESSNENFSNIAYSLISCFFSNDNKSAMNLLSLICEKYNLLIL